jgi:hypothetical protein
MALLAGIAVAAAAAMPFAGSAAPAAKSQSSCPDKALCVWTGANYHGQRVLITKRKLSNKLFNQINDRASSVKFRWTGTAVLWEDTGGGGTGYCFDGPRANRSNLADIGFDNSASSSKIYRNDVSC